MSGVNLFCKACNQIKSAEFFHKDSSSKRGHAYYCKECANRKSREWTASHSHLVEYKNKKQSSTFKHKYGISREERNSLLVSQQNKCAICKRILDCSDSNTHTDHCHQTKKVRGILCTNCNRGLGHFQESIENLKVAIEYLQAHTANGTQMEGTGQ